MSDWCKRIKVFVQLSMAPRHRSFFRWLSAASPPKFRPTADPSITFYPKKLKFNTLTFGVLGFWG
ncbi:MAG: hypothetical protein ACKO96_22025, partial [Flammeovirgaceae bacterium]